ncbi:MAG: protein-L-isoaspartate(D-aspartate) O-methyltransferase [Bacteroidetes bacterium]|nr:protein-L-isoaspartate(D-aspartate) O-methyltransferase [Bacteroidota bacterium]
MINDTYRHKGLRKILVDEIKKHGIVDENVLSAINKVPRHLFMESGFIEFAYKDSAFPIGSGQTISQPYTVAVQSELLEIKKGDKVLEVGTGSGYQAAVLFEMGAKIFTIERQHNLFLKSQILLKKLGYKLQFFFGDGYKGLPTYGPFDKIIITAGAPFIPEELKLQLKIGGILVIPVGENSQKMTKLVKVSENEYKTTEHGDFSFVPFLKGKSK